GDLITGRVFWQDHNCICIFDGNNEQITVWKQAIVYIKPLVDIVGERG
ncbi:RNA-binding protein hfq, partial [Dolichospermum sp. ST_sed5]|nr:RNA-binding protein hfq [Dolichospermum sp. ST_sed5]